MDRRSLLLTVAGGVLGGLAGCSSTRSPIDSARPATASATQTAGRSVASGTTGHTQPANTVEEPTEVGGNLPLSKDKLTRGAAPDAIPAIISATFGTDWSDFEPNQLQPDDQVIGIARAGEARAYPLRILNWHEITNDSLGGPLLVTYCPLCGSAIAAERTVNGQKTVFGVSGYLWNSNLVMYDELTESLWSQVSAMAIRGPATGDRLSLVPSRLTTWGTWQDAHPNTGVLLPPPASKTVQGSHSRDYNGLKYNRNPYVGYDDSKDIGIGANENPDTDERLHPKAQVLGVTSGGEAMAYPLSEVLSAGVVNDTVGTLPVVVSVAADEETLVAYSRCVDGETLTFEKASATHLQADGSKWSIITGRAVDGPHQGTMLAPATKKPQRFWFAWLDFHPNTGIYTAG